MENPIIDNRIVSGVTFATRFLTHIRDCKPQCAMGTEELEYLGRVAKKLQEYQIKTVHIPTEEEFDQNLPEIEEYKYLQRLGLIK